MKKRKVFKSWINELIQVIMIISFFTMILDFWGDFITLIIKKIFLAIVIIICATLLGKYSRDFINED
jgi:hypothetical protein